MVSSVEPHATEAGVRVLADGGNAADAAAAVAYALAVTHPSAGNLGGGGLALVRPPGGPTVAIDFREAAPAALTQARFDRMIAARAVGPAAMGVPGTPAGLELLRARYGRLPRTAVVAPAIALARGGHRLGKRQALALGWAWPQLRRDPEARRIFGRAERPLGTGALLVQPDLAATLERLAASGGDGFYGGPTAAALTGLGARGGLLDAADLRDYRAAVREPLTFSYRGVQVDVAPPPSAGGVAVAQMLSWRERRAGWTREHDSVASLHDFVEIARRAHTTRRFDVVDPDSVAGYDLAGKRQAWLDVEAVIAGFPPIDPDRATPSSAVHPLYEAAVRELEHTTHLSVVDADGMAVSLTTTLSAGFGARFVAPGTGVVMNNAVAAFGTAGADVPLPRRRMTTSMSPTLLVAGGETVAVLGSPGGDTIPNTLAQLVIHLLDRGLPVEDAVDAPRIHHGFVPDEIRYEQGRPIARELLDGLRARGHRISDRRIAIGDANVIVVHDGVAYGYADPREGGLAKGL
jgi:gamma-glutamyltranspeptidase / glutathione hydrolase